MSFSVPEPDFGNYRYVAIHTRFFTQGVRPGLKSRMEWVGGRLRFVFLSVFVKA